MWRINILEIRVGNNDDGKGDDNNHDDIDNSNHEKKVFVHTKAHTTNKDIYTKIAVVFMTDIIPYIKYTNEQ